MSNLKVRFVIATRQSRENFFKKTATGRSLSLYRYPFIELDLYELNKEGLPLIYNRSIENAKNNPAILVFAHDDVHLTDFFWVDQLVNSLNHFDIVGIVGNKKRSPNQTSWAYIDAEGESVWDKKENFSGVIGGGNGFPPAALHFFGPHARKSNYLMVFLWHAIASSS